MNVPSNQQLTSNRKRTANTMDVVSAFDELQQIAQRLGPHFDDLDLPVVSTREGEELAYFLDIGGLESRYIGLNRSGYLHAGENNPETEADLAFWESDLKFSPLDPAVLLNLAPSQIEGLLDRARNEVRQLPERLEIKALAAEAASLYDRLPGQEKRSTAEPDFDIPSVNYKVVAEIEEWGYFNSPDPEEDTAYDMEAEIGVTRDGQLVYSTAGLDPYDASFGYGDGRRLQEFPWRSLHTMELRNVPDSLRNEAGSVRNADLLKAMIGQQIAAAQTQVMDGPRAL